MKSFSCLFLLACIGSPGWAQVPTAQLPIVSKLADSGPLLLDPVEVAVVSQDDAGLVFSVVGKAQTTGCGANEIVSRVRHLPSQSLGGNVMVFGVIEFQESRQFVDGPIPVVDPFCSAISGAQYDIQTSFRIEAPVQKGQYRFLISTPNGPLGDKVVRISYDDSLPSGERWRLYSNSSLLELPSEIIAKFREI